MRPAEAGSIHTSDNTVPVRVRVRALVGVPVPDAAEAGLMSYPEHGWWLALARSKTLQGTAPLSLLKPPPRSTANPVLPTVCGVIP